MKPIPEADAAFWSRVTRTDGCWVWGGTLNKSGYGIWRGVGAHRVALNDNDPLGERRRSALHRCDNPPCVRPNHLYWGTAAENTRDMLERHPRFQGPRLHNFTFRIERRERERLNALAERRGQSVSQVVVAMLHEALMARAEKAGDQ